VGRTHRSHHDGWSESSRCHTHTSQPSVAFRSARRRQRRRILFLINVVSRPTPRAALTGHLPPARKSAPFMVGFVVRVRLLKSGLVIWVRLRNRLKLPTVWWCKWLWRWTCDSEGRGRFKSRPFRFQTFQPWASCSHRSTFVTKQYNLVPVKGRRYPAAGKVTVGLASHWPRVRLQFFTGSRIKERR